MAIQIVTAYDATHDNITHLPKGQAAGYTTGSTHIKWTADDWNAHPGAVRICQDAGATDTTADILDVEQGAATPGECPAWATAALASYDAVTRPGQRSPAIYMSASNVTTVVNALVKGGVTDGIGLWVANWNLTKAEATAEVLAAAGPFPVIGVQFTDAGVSYDTSVFDSGWLGTVSAPWPAGVVRHVSNGTASLHDVAKHEHVTAEHLGRLNAQHLAATQARAMLEYLAGGDWGVLDKSGARRVMPDGLVFYSTKPR